MKLEEALKALEEIVSKLEGEDLPLEEALSHFEQGIRLVKDCHQLLTQAEKRIEVLLQEADQWKIVPFEED